MCGFFFDFMDRSASRAPGGRRENKSPDLWRPITEPSGDWPAEDASMQKLEPDVRKNKGHDLLGVRGALSDVGRKQRLLFALAKPLGYILLNHEQRRLKLI